MNTPKPVKPVFAVRLATAVAVKSGVRAGASEGRKK